MYVKSTTSFPQCFRDRPASKGDCSKCDYLAAGSKRPSARQAQAAATAAAAPARWKNTPNPPPRNTFRSASSDGQ
jgi:hypothetical protein